MLLIIVCVIQSSMINCGLTLPYDGDVELGKNGTEKLCHLFSAKSFPWTNADFWALIQYKDVILLV